MVIYWFFKAFTLIYKRVGVLKVNELNWNFSNVFINYFWVETIWKAYLLSYYFVYNCLKKKYDKNSESTNIFFVILVNFIIKQLTGFSKKLLVDAFNISLKFRKWEGWVHFYNSWFFDLIPIVANNYTNIEQCKIYFEDETLKFNPLKNKSVITKKIQEDIEYLTNKEKNTLTNLYINIEKLKKFTFIKNLQIVNIKNYHMSFICDYYENNNILVSTLTTNGNWRKDCLYILQNNITNITSYISLPMLLDYSQIKEVKPTNLSGDSTRYILNKEPYLNLFLTSLVINKNYEITTKFNGLLFKPILIDTFNDLKQIEDAKFKGLTNYIKNLYFLSYTKLFNNSIYNSLYLNNKLETEKIEIILNYP